MDDDGITDCNIADCRPNLLNPACVLMTYGVGKGTPQTAPPLSLDNVQVGAAQPSASNPYNHIDADQ